MISSYMLNAQLLDYLLIFIVRSMDLPLNRLRCARCHAFRSISEYPFAVGGLHFETCIYCQLSRSYKQQSQQKLQQTTIQQIQQDSLLQISHYCSSCNQLRHPSQFDQFKTCNICRTTNKKAKCQRIQKAQLHNQRIRVSLAEAHLQEWVQRAGEEEVHTAARKSKGWEQLDFHQQKPLTIDNYLQEEEPEKLKKQWLEQQLKKNQEKEQ